MINAVFFKEKSSLIGFSVNGHAGYDDFGNDIVCASVSSAVQLTANLITDGFGIEADVSVKDGTISLRVTDSGRKDQAGVIINSLALHLKFLSEDYQGTINITNTEV